MACFARDLGEGCHVSEFLERIATFSPKRLALLADSLQARLEEQERGRHKPIAITGLSCRFPGAANPEAFWELLRQGQDAITEVPPQALERGLSL